MTSSDISTIVFQKEKKKTLFPMVRGVIQFVPKWTKMQLCQVGHVCVNIKWLESFRYTTLNVAHKHLPQWDV